MNRYYAKEDGEEMILGMIDRNDCEKYDAKTRFSPYSIHHATMRPLILAVMHANVSYRVLDQNTVVAKVNDQLIRDIDHLFKYRDITVIYDENQIVPFMWNYRFNSDHMRFERVDG